jgi:uncharacterized protein (DUF488 family)
MEPSRRVNRSAAELPMIYATGHSTMPAQKFIRILKAHSIRLLVDIRTIPKSRHNPQFNQNQLAVSLSSAGIGYLHLKELGGLRKPLKDSVNSGWRNASFRGYADYMQTTEFAEAVERLRLLASEKTVAIMCAEGNPFRCHRSLLADALTLRGARVIHIASGRRGRPHRVTPFARVRGTRITYPEEHGARRPRPRPTP